MSWLTDSLLRTFAPQWPVLAAAGLGALAVALSLPRPRPVSRVAGVLLGLPAIALGLAYIVPVVGPGWVEPALFFTFAALALLGGGLLVLLRNPARGAMAFALVVLSTSGLFLLQAAPFVMASTVIVYAGAIIVTFLFVLMLAQPKGHSDADDRSHNPALGAAAGFVLLFVLLAAVRTSYGPEAYARFEAAARPVAAAAAADSLSEAKKALGDKPDDLFRALTDQATALPASPAAVPGDKGEPLTLAEAAYELPAAWNRAEAGGEPKWSESKIALQRFTAAVREARETAGFLPPTDKLALSPWSGPPANKPLARDPVHGRPLVPAANVAALGRSLFSDYLLAVELGGTLLLVATVGAIAIAGGRRPGAN